jgi:hypothetical protein
MVMNTRAHNLAAFVKTCARHLALSLLLPSIPLFTGTQRLRRIKRYWQKFAIHAGSSVF